MTSNKKEWWARMIEKYGSEQGVRDFMAHSARQVQERSGSGFASMDRERVKEISKLGVEAKKRKEANEMAKLD